MSVTEPLEQLSPVKRALLEIRELKAKLAETERAQNEPIAIIGMGLRWPGGAHDPETAWQLLRDGVDAISEVPKDRWNIDDYYDPNPDAPGKMSTRWAGFINDIDKFDADFFGISPREAVSMDPQQRLLMKVAWEALENAGQSPEKLAGSATGVFVGIAAFDYPEMQMQYLNPANIDAYLATGSAHSVASGRLSYFLGLQGPSISLDTACSSSLVGVHLACRSLRSRESDMALAGGVNLIIIPELLINFSKSHMMAANGRCKTFDASADGFVRGEGAGLVVLKRLSDAIAHRDNILAVIRGSALNQDGRSSGLTAPNGPAQQVVIRQALLSAGVAPHEIGYVEAHGTGTSLGDPIEVQALGAVLREGRTADNPLMIGSIKTNIGHLETAAGVAGLIKAVLALKHQEIPPHLHLKELSPHIPWQDFPIVVPTQRTPWLASSGKRLAGVSSFGFSGTNAHVVIEEWESESTGEWANEGIGERERTQSISSSPILPVSDFQKRPLHLLNLSAKTEASLHELVQRYEKFFVENESAALADVCYSANAGRSHFDHRASFIASASAQMRERLFSFIKKEEALGVCNAWSDGTNRPEVVFLFTGQGGQYLNMGKQLFETQPTFRQALLRCDEILRAHLEQPLLSVLYPQAGERSPLDDTNYTQPATFALQYALAELWRSWGVQPGLIMGHSVGEIVASTVAGMMSLEDGLMIVSERGRLMHSLPQNGLMASLLAEEACVREVITPYTDRVAIAAINGPESTVISGERTAVLEILRRLEASGIKTRPLQVSNSFHSPLVEPVLDEFEASCRRAQYRTPSAPLFSSMRLEFVNEGNLLDATYWRHNLRYTVRYSEAMQKLQQLGYRVFIEIGPAPMLVAMGQKCFPNNDGVWLPSLRNGREDWEQMLETLATLYVNGVHPDWEKFDRDYPRRRVVVPTYPFQEQRYWIEVDRGLRIQERGLRIEDRDTQSTIHDPRSTNNEQHWSSIAEAARHQSQQIPFDMPLHTYPAKWQCLDRLATAYIVHALRALRAFNKKDEKHSIDGFMQRFHVLPTYKHLVQRWFNKLVNEGILLREGELFTNANALPKASPEAVLQKSGNVFAEISELLEYVQRCGKLLVPRTELLKLLKPE
ncbi:type I polyketide synthase [candidate division KSB1 bacterium]|nr:type I polyketide synthase [candidate division KSB1 bacterium]